MTNQVGHKTCLDLELFIKTNFWGSSLVTWDQRADTDLAFHWSESLGATSWALTLLSHLSVSRLRLLHPVVHLLNHRYGAKQDLYNAADWWALLSSIAEGLRERSHGQREFTRSLDTAEGESVHTSHSLVPACCWTTDGSQLCHQWWCSNSRKHRHIILLLAAQTKVQFYHPDTVPTRESRCPSHISK